MAAAAASSVPAQTAATLLVCVRVCSCVLATLQEASREAKAQAAEAVETTIKDLKKIDKLFEGVAAVPWLEQMQVLWARGGAGEERRGKRGRRSGAACKVPAIQAFCHCWAHHPSLHVLLAGQGGSGKGPDDQSAGHGQARVGR